MLMVSRESLHATPPRLAMLDARRDLVTTDYVWTAIEGGNGVLNSSSQTGAEKHVPHAVLVDLVPTVTDEAQTRMYSEPFSPRAADLGKRVWWKYQLQSRMLASKASKLSFIALTCSQLVSAVVEPYITVFCVHSLPDPADVTVHSFTLAHADRLLIDGNSAL